MSTANSSPEALSPSHRPPTTLSGTFPNADSKDAPFSVHSCTPQTLVDALVAARGTQEASRVLKEASEILASRVDIPLVSPEDKRTASANDEESDLGNALLETPIETSFLTPRMGKFSLQLHEGGLVATKLNDPSVKVVVSKNGGLCANIVVFPKPEDCKAIVYNRKLEEDSKPKKVGGSLVLIHLRSPLQVHKQKSPTLHLCFGLPFDSKQKVPIGPSLSEALSNPVDDPTERWAYWLHTAVGGKLTQVLKTSTNPNENGFSSYQAPNTSTTTAGMPFVGCYLGVNDGVLYPLEEGLLFFKPPRFLPRTSLHSIACGRGGDSSSRYVDMVVQCSDPTKASKSADEEEPSMETVEFTNIQREETGVLNAYIHNVLIPAMSKDAKARINSDEDDESSEVLAVEAVSGDDATDDGDLVEVANDDSNVESDDDEDYAGEEDNSDNESEDEESEEHIYGDDDEGIAVVADDFAKELVKEKRRKQDDSSATESEDDESKSGKTRVSKRLRRTGS